jgi:DNA-binding GntR family transcriptional regulator
LRRKTLYIPSVILDRTHPEPLHLQLSKRLRRAIRSGEVQGASRLPSTRVLSKLLGVSRNTVVTAYEALAADGLICSEPGSGMTISSTRTTNGMLSMNLPKLIREAQYPVRAVSLADPDGKPLSLDY